MKKYLRANNILNFLSVVLLSTTIFVSCKKNDNNNISSTPPDLTTKINSSVSGFVTDENNAAVINATVQFGTATLSTDKYGYFEAKDIEVIKDAATVTVTKAGYFKGIKTFMASAGKSAFFRIKLIPKTIAGTVNGNSGGTVTLSNGLSVNLPANGVVNAITNAAYTSIINVAAYWINPANADLPGIMPGDLRGVNTDGNVQLLTTYGMAAVELTGSSGELLQIATGKKATLSFPIPAALSSSAPASIPLWYFDEAKGLWKEEGSAAKSGINYVGEVSHFSYWNCDVPSSYVQFNCTIVNQNGQPLQNAFVKVSVVGTNSMAYGFTDSAGYTGGAVPNNSQLRLEVFSNWNCGSAVYTQTFNTTNITSALGTLTVNAANASAILTGTVTSCSNTPVTNGYIIMIYGNQSFRCPVTNGAFNFTTLLCSAPANVTVIAEDVSNLQQSTLTNITLNAGNNAMGNLQACGVTVQEYVNYTINGVTYSYTPPFDSLLYNRQVSLAH